MGSWKNFVKLVLGREVSVSVRSLQKHVLSSECLLTPVKVIGVSLPVFALLALDSIGQAQVLPDATLGSEVLQMPGQLFLIQAGTQEGSNLFHSFLDFSVPSMGTARFVNSATIENIFTRVTGSNRSEINGVLEAQGNANLFLLNPNGFLFGQDAQLQIGGSFFATSAQSLQFADGTRFDVQPSSSPRLSVSVPVGLQYGATPGSITVLGRAGSNRIVYDSPESSLDRSNSTPALQVQPGNRITLLGGEVQLIGGSLAASGGVDLGGVGPGESIQLEGVRPVYSGVSDFRDVLIDQGFVDTSGPVAGPITVTGQSIRLLTRAILLSQNESSMPTGAITLQASDTVELAGPSAGNVPSTISSSPRLGSGGSAGAITIRAQQLLIRDGGAIESRPFGDGGVGGDILIETRDTITLQGRSLVGAPSVISTDLPGGGFSATAGNIQLRTRQLELQDGTVIGATSSGVGDGGNIDIQASESVRLSGMDSMGGRSSQIVSILNPDGINPNLTVGQSGDIAIDTPRLVLSEGATISAGSRGIGDGGRVSITGAEDIILEGTDRRGLGSVISNNVFFRGAQGNAGPIEIETERLTLRDGGRILAASFVEGAGGDITIRARESVTLEGSDRRGSASNIVTGITEDALGDSGALRVETGDLTLRDGGRLVSLTLGQGDAGDLTVDATGTILLEGVSPRERPSNIAASVAGPEASGNGGDITLRARDLVVRDRAFISAETQGSGRAGNVEITTERSITLDTESNISSSDTEGLGPAGNVFLTTERLTIDQDAAARVSAIGPFAAGSLFVEAQRIDLMRGGSLNAETEAGARGNINVQAELLNIAPTGSITTNATGSSTAGDINLDTELLIVQDDGEILARAISNRGGNINIETEGFFRQDKGIIDASSQLGVDGIVSITRPDVEPNPNEAELPSQVTDVDQLIARSCLRRNPNQQGQFLITGRGGLPRRPEDAAMASFDIYQADAAQAEGRSPSESNPADPSGVDHRSPVSGPVMSGPVISEAVMFRHLANGKVILAERPCA